MKCERILIKFRLLLILTCIFAPIFVMSDAGSAELYIKAEFKPSIFDPSKTAFEMTIPSDGFCGVPCHPGDYVRATTITAQNRKFDASSDDRRLWSYFGGDARWRDIEVKSVGNSDPYVVRLRLVMVAQDLSETNGGLLGSPGVNGMSPCSGRVGVGHDKRYRFATGMPSTNSTVSCSRRPSKGYVSDSVTVRQFDVGFKIVSPNPLSMPNGKYVGRTTYTVGNGADLDFGEAVYSDDRLTLNLELDVEHQFELKIPPGSERAVLEPPHGWVQWLNRGKPPTRLRRDVPFALSGSMPFAMTLRCSDRAVVDDACVIRELRGSEAPLQVSVSVQGTATSSGRPVVHLPLTPDVRLGVEPNGYLNNAQSRLHIEVDEAGVDEMVQHPGSEYRGNITVVFDAMAD